MIPLTLPQINALLAGKPVEFKKKREQDDYLFANKGFKLVILAKAKGVKSDNSDKLLFQVGRDYTVSLKGNRKALTYLPNSMSYFFCKGNLLKPLRFRVLSIKGVEKDWLIKGVMK